MNITSVCFVIIYSPPLSTKFDLQKKSIPSGLSEAPHWFHFRSEHQTNRLERERDFFFSYALVTIVKTEDTRGPKYLYRCVGRSLLDGSSTPWENPFGKVPQQAAEAGFRTGVELECNR